MFLISNLWTNVAAVLHKIGITRPVRTPAGFSSSGNIENLTTLQHIKENHRHSSGLSFG